MGAENKNFRTENYLDVVCPPKVLCWKFGAQCENNETVDYLRFACGRRREKKYLSFELSNGLLNMTLRV
jgi:hypothetical protein